MRKIFSLMMAVLFGVTMYATTYTAAGTPAELFGTTWDPTNTANDLVDNQTTGHNYILNFENVTLPAGEVKFKICEDHAWATAYPASDYTATIAESGVYVIAISFDSESKEVGFRASKTADADVLPTIALHGNFTGEWKDTELFAEASDKATASLKLNLAAGNYEFGVRVNGTWTSNGSAFTRENNSYAIAAGSGNLTLAADVAGEYELVWTYATNTLAITFPEKGEEPVATETLKAFPKDSVSFIGYAWGEDVAKNKTIFDANNYIMMVSQGNALQINKTIGLQIGNSSKPSAFVFRLGEEADLTVAIARNGSDMTAKLYYMGETTDTLTAANLATEGTLCASVDITADNEAGVLAKKKAAAGYYKVYGTLRFGCPYIIAAESGDTPEPPTPEETVTVYFYNNLGWEAVNAFVWPAEGAAYKDWPGEAAKKEAEQINEKDVYAYTFPAKYVNIIFNNGTVQTADLKWDAEKPYFVPGDKNGEGKYEGKWYAKADIPTGGDTPEETVTVYFYNNLGWAAVNAFVWGAEAYKAWPGEAAQKEAEKINDIDVYAYTFPASYVNVIFNNGEVQTADLKWDADKPYFVPSGEKNGEGKYTGTWYAKADIPADEPVQPADVMTVSYNGSEVSTPEGFFTHDASGKFNFNAKFNGATYDGIEFTSGLKFESSTKILFTTAKVATVTIVQSTYSANTIKFDDVELAVSDAVEGTGYRAYTLNNVAAGDHSITRGSGESGLFYVKVEYAGGEQPEEPAKYYLAGTMNEWTIGANEFVADGDTLRLSIALEADSVYEYKVVKVAKDTTWFGTGFPVTMEYGNSTDWHLDGNENAGLHTTKAANYDFIFVPKDNNRIDVIMPAPDPEAPKYYAKNNWDGVTDWTWKEMTMKSDDDYQLECVFGGTGVNINTTESDEGAAWYAAADIAAFDASYEPATLGAMDTIVLMYTPSEKMLAALIIGKYAEPVTPPTPETKYYAKNNWDGVTDWTWKEMTMKSDDDYQLECVFGGTGVNINTTESDEGAAWYPIEKIEAFDASYEPATLGALDTIVLMYTPSEKMLAALIIGKYAEPVTPPTPETKYYAKNNWDGVTDWTWKEMTMKSDDDYQLECVFGGTGVNINTAESDEGAAWYAAADIAAFDASYEPATLGALDTIVLMYTPSEKMLAALIIGKYAEPVDPNPAKYYIAGTMTEWAKNMVEMAAGEDNSYSVDIALEADSLYMFKVVRVQGTDTAWYGAGMDATMHYGNSTDWSLYGDVDVKLQTTKAADYKFIFVANEAKNISVVIPEPDPYVPVHQNGFYLMGSHNEWAIDDAYLFVRNEQSEVEEYSLNVTLTVGQKIKPAYVENDEAKEWYGANDFEITEAYAGAKTVYFRPVRNGEWGAFGGFIYIADQEGTGLFNTAVEGKAVKTISNGMLIIEKAGVRYNVMGQIIR